MNRVNCSPTVEREKEKKKRWLRDTELPNQLNQAIKWRGAGQRVEKGGLEEALMGHVKLQKSLDDVYLQLHFILNHKSRFLVCVIMFVWLKLNIRMLVQLSESQSTHTYHASVAHC